MYTGHMEVERSRRFSSVNLVGVLWPTATQGKSLALMEACFSWRGVAVKHTWFWLGVVICPSCPISRLSKKNTVAQNAQSKIKLTSVDGWSKWRSCKYLVKFLACSPLSPESDLVSIGHLFYPSRADVDGGASQITILDSHRACRMHCIMELLSLNHQYAQW